jgi:hypothetical protein
MKTIFYAFLLIVMQHLHSQENNISKYESFDYEYTGVDLIKKFQIENKESLLLKYTNEDYLVFDNEEVYKINYIQSENILVYKIKLKDELKEICFQILNSLKKINPDNLNIIKNEAGTILTVQDGFDYSLDLFKSNAKITYETYAPEAYINNKYPYYEERETVLNAFINLKKVFYNEEIEEIEKLKTIYIVIDDKNDYNKIKIETKKLQKLTQTNFIFSDFKTLTFFHTNNVYIRKEDLYKNHQTEIIPFEIINKYRYKKSLGFLSGKKTIYLVFIKNNKCKKVSLKNTILKNYEL